MMAIGEKLKELRENENKSQDEMAKEIGVTKSSWAKYERNERVPRDEVKIRIAKFFKKTVQEIFFGQDEYI
ncbi:MAG: helix-turn-helix transcriptional regulator [Ruminiclostridium sp.]